MSALQTIAVPVIFINPKLNNPAISETYLWTNIVVTGINFLVFIFLCYKLIECPCGSLARKMTKIAVVTNHIDPDTGRRGTNQVSYIERPRSLPSCSLILPSIGYCCMALLHGLIIMFQTSLFTIQKRFFVDFICGPIGGVFGVLCYFMQHLLLYIFYISRLHITFRDTHMRYGKNIANRVMTVAIMLAWPLFTIYHVSKNCELKVTKVYEYETAIKNNQCHVRHWPCPGWTLGFIAFDFGITAFSLFAFVFGLRKISRRIRPSTLHDPTFDRLHQVAYRTAVLTGIMLTSSAVFDMSAFVFEVPIMVSLAPIDRAVRSICLMLMFPRFFSACDSSFETCFIVTLAYCECCRWHPHRVLIGRMEPHHESFDTLIEKASVRTESEGDLKADPDEERDFFDVHDRLDIAYGLPGNPKRPPRLRSASDSATVSFSGRSSCVAMDDLQSRMSTHSRFSSGFDESRSSGVMSMMETPSMDTMTRSVGTRTF